MFPRIADIESDSGDGSIVYVFSRATNPRNGVRERPQ